MRDRLDRRHQRRRREQEHAAVADAEVETVIRPDGHRHGLVENRGLRGDDHVPFHRSDRYVANLSRPGAGGVHGDARGEVAAVGAEDELDALPLRRLVIAAEDLHRADEAVGRGERAADDGVVVDGRIDRPRLVRADDARLRRAAGVLHRDRVAEAAEHLLGLREKEISVLRVSGIDAGLLLETEQLFAREHRQPDVHRRLELGAETAGCARRAAAAEGGGAVDDDDVADAEGGEVVRDARAGHPRSDDQHFNSSGHFHLDKTCG